MRTLLLLLRKYNYVLIFIVLEVIAFVLISNHNHYQHSILANANREIAGRLYSRVEGSREYLSLRKVNESLVMENARLRNLLDSRNLIQLDSMVIDSLAKDSTNRSYMFIPARIVHSTYRKQFNYLTINAGRNDSITNDMAVISNEGIVGIVLESSANFATVLPVINRDFRLSVKIKKNNFVGILQWEGGDPRLANLTEIPYHAEVANGDTIVTSGYSALFPEGLFVGTIKEFSLIEGNFYRIEIDLGTDYQRLFYVDVIKNLFQDEQRELEENLNQ